MLVDIGKLPKKVVLLALYNNALGEGEYYKGFATGISHAPGSLSSTHDVLNRNNFSWDFSYVDLGAGSKPLYVDLTKVVFNSAKYDYYHGEGLAAKVVGALLVEQKIAPLLKQLRDRFKLDEGSIRQLYLSSWPCKKDIENILKLDEFNDGACISHPVCPKSKSNL